MSYLVFVYGRLKIGCGNHHLLEDQKLIWENAETVFQYEMLCRGCPMVIEPQTAKERVFGKFDGEVETEKTGFVLGELYEVDHDCLVNALDILEGHPNFYERRLAPILNGNNRNEVKMAWVYFQPKGQDMVCMHTVTCSKAHSLA